MDGSAILTAELPSKISKPLPEIFVGAVLRLFDVLAVLAVGGITYLLYVHSGDPEVARSYAGSILIGALVTELIFHGAGIYKGDQIFSKRLRINRVVSGWAIAFCVLLAIAFALKITGNYSRFWAVSWFVTTPAAIAVGRFLFRIWINRLAHDGRFASRTIIVGAGEHGQRLAAHLDAFGDARIRLLGFVDDRKSRIPPSAHGYDVLGNTADLITMIQRGAVDQVFVALPWNAEGRLLELVRQLALTPVQIRLAPDLVGFALTDRTFTQIARLPMLHVFDRPISGWAHVAKRAEDLLLASLACLLLAPLFGVIAIAIKLSSPGPVLFKQRRYGFNNNLIEVLKFRTMHTHLADADAHEQTQRDDPRITPLGAFLRRSSLDELPQLFNVLRGDMSLVGPRPHALANRAEGRLFEDVADKYAARHKVKPGITGWAQVNGWRGAADTVTKIEKRVEYDLYYIDHWSILFDLEVMLRTLFVVFKAENAY